MSNVNCPSSDPEIAKFCACLKATDDVSRALQIWENQIQEITQKKAIYNQYQNDLQNWQNMTGNYSRWRDVKYNLENEEKHWNNCVHESEANAGRHDDWCANDIGDGWFHASKGYVCNTGIQAKGICKRRPDKVNREFQNSGYYNDQPAAISDPGNIPAAPSNFNIQCCTQIFQDISANRGNVNISDVNQNCVQQINNNINNRNNDIARAEAQARAEGQVQAQQQATQEQQSQTVTQVPTQQLFPFDINNSNNNIYIALTLISCLIFILFSSSLIGVIVMV